MVAVAGSTMTFEKAAHAAGVPRLGAAAGGMVGAIERCIALGGLLDAPAPVTASQMSERLSLDPGLVSQPLGALVVYGQARRLPVLDDGPPLFVAAERPECAYVRCPVCGRLDAVAEHPLESMRRRLRERFGHELELARFVFAWPCEPCREPGAQTEDKWLAAERSYAFGS